MTGILPSLLLLLCFLFTAAAQTPTAEDAALENELDFYCTNRSGSPAEFKADYVRSAYGQIVRGQLMHRNAVATDAEARQILLRLRDEIRTGWDWKIPPAEVVIPFFIHKPVVDGRLDDPCWERALTFTEEYLRSTTDRVTPAACWKVGYDGEYLYWAAQIPDDDIEINLKQPYLADSLELFVMPDIRLRTYCEIVIHPAPGHYTRWCTTGHGGVYMISPWEPQTLRYAAVHTAVGWQIEAQIAFRELPGYLLGNPAKSGQQIRFQLIRTDLSRGKNRYSTPVPFLYDGHNIYGYIRATLGAADATFSPKAHKL